jgi:hypothetical protein
MEPKILIMWKEQDYCEIQIGKEITRKTVSEMYNTFGLEGREEELLYSLRIEDAEIPANQLRNYGSTIPLTEGTVANETIMDGLERFFEKASKYAEKHKAPYVLVQDLRLMGKFRHTLDIGGLAQLLIE